MEILLILISLTSIWGAVVYKLYALNWIGVFLVICLVVTNLSRNWRDYKSLITNYFNQLRIKNYELRILDYSVFLFFCFFVFVFSCFFVLFKSRSDLALTSPWEVIPQYFFLFYFFASLSLVFALIKIKSDQIKLILISFFAFLTFSVIWIIYRVGFGFDSFIHQATLSLIDKNGFIDPKPFYYLGQYGLEIILHKIFFLPIVWIDKLLVPFLATLFLPWIIWTRFKNLFLVLFCLIFSLSFLTFTTPQNLAYLFLLLTIIQGLKIETKKDFKLNFILALATLAIHPIAGIPAIQFSIIKLQTSNFKLLKSAIFSRLLSCLEFLIVAITLPLVFYFTNQVEFSWVVFGENLKSFFDFRNFSLNWAGSENVILNTVYFYFFNLNWIFSLVVIFGIYLAWRKQLLNKLKIYLFFFLAFFFSFLLMQFFSFNSLIDYEQGAYNQRIFLESLFFLLPFLFLTFEAIGQKISLQNKKVKLILIIFGCSILTVSLYLTYPRKDNYFNTRGQSVSRYDLEAVNWIEKDAQGVDYVVLANQQTSAAALHEFGFEKYYQNNSIFYYSIPTGGPLYQLYLKMVYDKPEKKYIDEAISLTGAQKVYFVLNKYWWASPKILEEAKLEAKNWQKIGEHGEVYVFGY